MVLESLLAQILSDVYRRPRILLHLTIVFIALVLLGYAGIYLPLSIANAVGLGSVVSQERGELVVVDLIAALIAIVIYLALVKALFSHISGALNKALEHLDLSSPFNTINKLRNSCFVKDILSTEPGKKSRYGLILLSLFSAVIILSYYSSIAFFLYALNDWLSMIGVPLLQLLTSSGRIVFLAVTDLFLIATALVLLIHMQWGSDTEGEGDRDMFNEWIEYLVRKYFFDNCTCKRGAVILASLTPLAPKYGAPRLRYSTLMIPRSLAEARFEKLVGSDEAGSESHSIVDYNKFKECISKPLDMEKLKEGIFKNLCVAKLYVKERGKEKHLGILIAFTATAIVGQKHALRMLSYSRAIVSVKPEEEQTYIALVSSDPSVAEFVIRLVTG